MLLVEEFCAVLVQKSKLVIKVEDLPALEE